MFLSHVLRPMLDGYSLRISRPRPLPFLLISSTNYENAYLHKDEDGISS